MILGFEPLTVRLRVSSHNQKTRAPVYSELFTKINRTFLIDSLRPHHVASESDVRQVSGDEKVLVGHSGEHRRSAKSGQAFWRTQD